MKKLFCLSLLGLSFQLLAAPVQEFDEATEIRCYNEARALSCLDKNGEQVSACLTQKKAKLSSECQTLHEAKTTL
jgi:Skp family chaperone for outer membrane proteins